MNHAPRKTWKTHKGQAAILALLVIAAPSKKAQADEIEPNSCSVRLPTSVLSDYVHQIIFDELNNKGQNLEFTLNLWPTGELNFSGLFKTFVQGTSVSVRSTFDNGAPDETTSSDDIISVATRIDVHQYVFTQSSRVDSWYLVIDFRVIDTEHFTERAPYLLTPYFTDGKSLKEYYEECLPSFQYPNVVVEDAYVLSYHPDNRLCYLDGWLAICDTGITKPSASDLADQGFSRCSIQERVQPILAELLEQPLYTLDANNTISCSDSKPCPGLSGCTDPTQCRGLCMNNNQICDAQTGYDNCKCVYGACHADTDCPENAYCIFDCNSPTDPSCQAGECKYELRFKHLMDDAGGARANAQNIDLLIPCVKFFQLTAKRAKYEQKCTNVPAQDYEDTGSCIHHGWFFERLPEQTEIYAGVGLATGTTFEPSLVMDWPKQIQAAISSIPAAQTLGVSVYCNHGNTCTSDIDNDGFCDDNGQDKCPQLFTGSNCDLDDDGQGDGALFENGGCQLAFLQAGSDKENPQYEKLRQEYCGACDLCFGKVEGFDLDNDGVGDKCDVDKDGDGYTKEYDCDDRNPTVNKDLDNDKVCDNGYPPIPPNWNQPDPPPIAACYQWCNYADNYYWNVYFSKEVCRKNCLKDTCIYTDAQTDAYCAQVLECVQKRNCEPADYEQCTAVYANPVQEDSDGDGIGNKCELAAVSELEFSRMGHSILFQPGETHGSVAAGERYNIAFRTQGGTFQGTNPPQFNPETRTGVSVGACSCDYTDADGNWDPNECYKPKYCRRDHERIEGTNQLTWNPIRASECRQYPVAQALVQHQKDKVEDLGLCYSREIDFTRDPNNPNADFKSLTWYWENSVLYGLWTDNSFKYEAVQTAHGTRTTKVRVAWPDFGVFPIYSGQDLEVAYSQSREVYTSPPLNLQYGYPLDTQQLEARIPRRMNEEISPLDPVAWVSTPGYYLTREPQSNTYYVHGFGKNAFTVDKVWEVLAEQPLSTQTKITGTGGYVTESLIGGQADSQKPAVFLYQEPSSLGLDDNLDNVPIKAQLLVGVENESTQINLVSVETLTGQETPAAYNTQVVWLDRIEKLLLFGNTNPDSNTLTVWQLDLDKQTWKNSEQINLPSNLHGYNLITDPTTNNVLLVGGEGTRLASLVYEIDTISWTASEVKLSGPLDTNYLALSSASYYYNVPERTIYLYGGESDGTSNSDVVKIDLIKKTWEVINTPANQQATSREMIYFDRQQNQLWIGNFTSDAIVDGLDLWTLDKTNSWYQTQNTIVQQVTSYPVTNIFVASKDNRYLWNTPDEEPLPGQLVLAVLQADNPVLELTVNGQSGDRLGRSVLDEQTLQEKIGFWCPKGQTCSVNVIGAGADADFTSYTLNLVEAAPVETDTLTIPGQTNDIILKDEALFVGGVLGVTRYNASSLVEEVSSKQWSARLITGMDLCGGYLCASRLGIKGLSIIDITNEEEIFVKANIFTAGVGWDIAANGATAYVAHGILGVGSYDVSNPSSPSLNKIVCTGGLVRAVATSKNVLAAGQRNGKVVLYDLKNEEQQVGILVAKGKISKIRFYAGFLWVEGLQKNWVEVWDVSNPAMPTKVGEFETESLDYFTSHLRGKAMYTFNKHGLKVYSIEPIN